MKAIITSTQLTAGYYQQDEFLPIIKGVDFSLSKGESVAIIGESGSGKTTFSDALLGLLRLKGGAVESGVIELCGAKEQKDRFVGKEIAYVPQDPNTALDPLFPILSNFNELFTHVCPDVKKNERVDRIHELFDYVGLDPKTINLKSYPHQLSGGMKQRVLIALALLPQPQCIIADEPTSNLDVTTEKMIMELFARIKRDKHISLLLTTHNLRIAKNYCDRVYVFYQGEIVESGTNEQIFSRPQHPYTQGLVQAIKV